MRQVRFKFNSIRMRSAAFRTRGPHDVIITATVDGAAVGEPFAVTTENRQSFDLPESYAVEIDVDARPMESDRPRPVVVELEIRWNEPTGTWTPVRFTHTVRWPFDVREHSITASKAILRWELEDPNPPTSRDATPGPVFACRESPGGLACSTVGATDARVRIEAHQVLPTPSGAGAPRRPTFPRGFPRGFHDDRAYTVRQLGSSAAKNTIENPAVIPILPSGEAASESNAARFKITYYRPHTMALAETDEARLEWRTVSLGGGEARFLGSPNGRKVRLHGTAPGMIGLEIRLAGRQVAFYRALVAPLIYIPARATLMHAVGDSAAVQATRPSPDTILGHFKRANKFLWQMGAQLRLSSRTGTAWFPAGVDGTTVRTTSVTGIFEMDVPANFTTNVNSSTDMIGVGNSLPWVANFAYIKGDSDSNRGVGIQSIQQSQATIRDEGTPSSSWARPSGVAPDGEATAKTMNVIFWGPTSPANRFGMYLTDNHASDLDFSGTLAHEFGHILNLGHRIENPDGSSPFSDGISHPPDQNVMHWVNDTDIAQDFDILQALAIRRNALIRHHTP